MKRVIISVMFSLGVAGCAEESATPPPGGDVDAGRAIVAANCTGCHGLDGRGKTAEIPNLAAQPADYLVEAMHAYRDGQRRHAALRDIIEGFSEADIRNIATFFAGVPALPASAIVTGESSYRAGEDIASACTACHGPQGFSTEAGVPSLAGQQPAYLIVSTQEYASGNRGHADKQAMLQGLAAVDIEKMAMYFAAQAPPKRQPPPFGDPLAGEARTAICGSCHGARGISSDPMIPTLAGQEPTYLVSAIKAYRSDERSHEDMVADRSDAEIEDIAAFYSVQALGSAPVGDAAVQEAVARCDRCHDRSAGDSSLTVPRLRGQQQEYLARVMRQYRDEERDNAMMHKMSAGFSDELVESIAEYYAHQSTE